MGVLGTGTAAAQPVSLTLKYICMFPVVGGHAVTMKVSADIPRSIAVGASTPKFTIHGVATVSDSTTARALSQIGVKTVDGTVDAAASVASPQGNSHFSVRFKLGSTAIPTSGPFDLEATAKAPTLKFRKPGVGHISVGDLTLHLTPRDANGNPNLGRINPPCEQGARQNDTLASFEITAASHSVNPSPTHSATGTPTGTATPKPTHSATLSPTGSATLPPTGSTPPGMTTAATPGPIHPTPVSDNGPGSRSLVYLGLAALVVGAAAFLFIAWSKRRAGH